MSEFLNGKTAEKLYQGVKNLPIIDYHCHLSPREIYEDKPYDNIGNMWLSADHYKWRLMRSAGIEEQYITGNSSDFEKFTHYAKAVELALGNPLYHWSNMELRQFFQIDLPLNSKNAKEIWDKANKTIKEKTLSPRKLIEMSNVEYIATTDDPCDTLQYHILLRKDESFKTKVAPSFRVDNILQLNKASYRDYIEKLSDCASIKITDITSLKKAIVKRIDFFKDNGCRFSDVGIPDFPNSAGEEAVADTAFRKAINGDTVTEQEYHVFLGSMHSFLAKEYKKRDIVMQLHLSVVRNPNSVLFESIGADCGCDCIGDSISVSDLSRLFNNLNSANALPKTICYTLNPQMYYPLAVLARSFRNVSLGAAWWFCDHKRGIEEQLSVYSETATLATFYGMLTDSRSFLSYARHDYFRRILCSFVAEKLDNKEFYGEELAAELVRKICYHNIKEITK